MRMMAMGFIAVSIIGLGFSFRGKPHAETARQDNSVISKMRSDSRNRHREAIEQVTEERRVLIEGLIAILTDDMLKNEDSKAGAVVLLGTLRAEEASELLVRRIAQIRPQSMPDGLIGDEYPCARALSRIGAAASPILVEWLARPTDRDMEVWLRLETLVNIEGTERAKSLLRDRLGRESDDKGKAALKAAISRADKVKRG